MCGCTDHTHEEVRAAIREHKLLSIPQVMKFMEWRTPNGCATCRPALNYYLICAWPHEAEDDPQSRFINERAHANIQKDGTYSVVPRMWGGVTTPAELRRIADVADKYNIPTVKVTGGQRIDLLGVKKEDLPKVWADLDMPSGHAYGKALRTVKTCVGCEWCRFGVQDSTQMGIDLEKAFWTDVGAAQGQARGVRLPAQLRRSGDQGRRHHRRRFRLGNLRRRQRRHQDRSRAVPGQGENARKKCWNTPAPSSSSTAKKRATSTAPCITSRASASTT